jgi:hypothetical protein
MNQRTRIILALAIIVAIAGVVLGVTLIRRLAGGAGDEVAAGAVPIIVDGEQVAAFVPEDLERLEQVSFVDDEDGKTQEGWLLRDVLLLYLDEGQLSPQTTIVVSSSSRGKSAQLTWAEVEDPQNWVMFDLSGRGTLKLVSVLERLDVRDEWVQDSDRIEVTSP